MEQQMNFHCAHVQILLGKTQRGRHKGRCIPGSWVIQEPPQVLPCTHPQHLRATHVRMLISIWFQIIFFPPPHNSKAVLLTTPTCACKLKIFPKVLYLFKSIFLRPAGPYPQGLYLALCSCAQVQSLIMLWELYFVLGIEPGLAAYQACNITPVPSTGLICVYFATF